MWNIINYFSKFKITVKSHWFLELIARDGVGETVREDQIVTFEWRSEEWRRATSKVKENNQIKLKLGHNAFCCKGTIYNAV